MHGRPRLFPFLTRQTPATHLLTPAFLEHAFLLTTQILISALSLPQKSHYDPLDLERIKEILSCFTSNHLFPMAILSTSFRSIANKNHADHTRIAHSENEQITREHNNTSEVKPSGTAMDLDIEIPPAGTNSTSSGTRPATFHYRPTNTSSLRPSSLPAKPVTNPTFTFGTLPQYSYNPASTTVFQSRKRKVSNGADWGRVKRQKPCSAEVASWPIEMDTPMEM